VKHPVAAAEIVLVMDGTLSVDAISGDIGLSTGDSTRLYQSGNLEITEGEGITGNPGAEVSYHAGGQLPVTILLITLAMTGR
jgi:hypothetical protein